MRQAAEAIKLQAERRMDILKKQLKHASVEIDAVSIHFQLEQSIADKAHAEMLLRQVSSSLCLLGCF